MGEPAVETNPHEWTLSETKFVSGKYEVKVQPKIIGERGKLPKFDRTQAVTFEKQDLRSVEKAEALTIIRDLVGATKLSNESACQLGFGKSCDQITSGN